MADAADPPPPIPPENFANVLIRNRIPAGPAGGQNNLMNVRQRLFHAIYFKAALMYAQIVPAPLRRALEYFVLFKALMFFAALVYLHMAFIKNPATCLQHVKNWPRDGVLRVEVIPNLEQQRELLYRKRSHANLVMDLKKYYFYGIGPQTKMNYDRWHWYERILADAGFAMETTYVNYNETVIYYMLAGEPIPAADSDKVVQLATSSLLLPLKQADVTTDNAEDGDFLYWILFKPSMFLMLMKSYGNPDEQYIVEYSLEYGHLRLSPETRKRLRIPVRVVQLDPMKDKCFGDRFSKFMLKKVLGYDDLLMASVRVIAEQEDNKGYLRNVITGEHYRFVSMWWAAWSSYPTAFSVMLLFTFSISMLLRFSHHQIFVFIVDLLQMLEFNVTARFPIAPLLTVILALVGMEAIMSEFFNDTTTAFYIILIVWIADQYDAICCHTTITKRHWLRFFYLYHFAFYAYHYRFSGQNRNLSLITSWLFIEHSMIYFFHRYELPVIAQHAQILILTRNQPNAAAARVGAGAAGAGGGNGNMPDRDAAAGTGAAAGAGGAAGAGAGASGGGGAGGGNVPTAHTVQQGGRRILFFRRPRQQQQEEQEQQQPQVQQQIRIPLFGILPLRNRPLTWEGIQRTFLQRGWRAHLPVRVQVGNVHGFNVRSMQQNAALLAAAAAVAQRAANAANNADAASAQRTNSASDVGHATNAAAATTANVGANMEQQPTTSAASSSTSTSPPTTLPSTTHESNENNMDNQIANATTSLGGDIDVKANQSMQHQNTTTGNNAIEQPETVQNNKVENEVTKQPQQKAEQQRNDGVINMRVSDGSKILFSIAEGGPTTTSTTTPKQTNNSMPLITIKPTTSTSKSTTTNAVNITPDDNMMAKKTITKDSNSNSNSSSNSSSEQLESDLCAIATEVENDCGGGPKAKEIGKTNNINIIEYGKSAQEKSQQTTRTTTTTTNTTTLPGDEIIKEIPQIGHTLMESSMPDILRPINQVYNVDHNCGSIKTTSTPATTIASVVVNPPLQTTNNNNFDMIDNATENSRQQSNNVLHTDSNVFSDSI